jgi:hypothetical protein
METQNRLLLQKGVIVQVWASRLLNTTVTVRLLFLNFMLRQVHNRVSSVWRETCIPLVDILSHKNWLNSIRLSWFEFASDSTWSASCALQTRYWILNQCKTNSQALSARTEYLHTGACSYEPIWHTAPTTYQYFAIDAITASTFDSAWICMMLSMNVRPTQISVFISASLCWIVCQYKTRMLNTPCLLKVACKLANKEVSY